MSDAYVSPMLLICLVMMLFWCSPVFGAPEVAWISGWGTAQEDHVFEGVSLQGREFCVVGKCGEPHSSQTDGFVMKGDVTGKQEWQTLLGERGCHDEARCIVEVRNGFLIGGTAGVGRNSSKACLWKLSSAGEIEWKKVLDHTKNGAIRGLDVVDDESLVATGYIQSDENVIPFISDESVGIVLKFNVTGEIEWQKELPFSQGSKILASQKQGTITICGTTWRDSLNSEHQDAFLVQFSSQGKKLFQHFYGGAAMDQCFDFDTLSDGFVLAGHTVGRESENWDVWLVRTDSEGKMLWQQTYDQLSGGTSKKIFDECYGVQQTSDGGFVLACGSGIEPDNVADEESSDTIWAACLLKTDGLGLPCWTYVFHQPESGHNACEWVIPFGDKEYLMLLDSDHLGDAEPSNVGFIHIHDK